MSGPNRREFIRNVGLAAAGGALGSAGETAEKPQGAGADAQEPFATRINIADDVVRRDDFDLIIVGGGIAGTSCAISAARNGCRVALVHERSMLGGNSSSEVRLFPEDNLHAQPWIKEGGIHEEFHTEERTRNHAIYKEGSMNCHWDLVLYEWVIREPNIKLFLNTHMHRVFMKDDATIRAIYCIQLGTEKELELSAPLFVDATGDGVLAHRAKADYRWGREARSEYGEPLAPDTADEKVMGNTLFFRAEDTGKPVPFKLPDWAVSFPTHDDLTARYHGYREAGYWWIEVGAPYHPISDNNEITHEALRNVLGVWDHIKHHCVGGMENWGLEFVGFWPYKRECRRIIGDHVVTQKDVQDPHVRDDDVAYGCWGIDIHTQGGILARDQIPYPPPRRDEFWDHYYSQVYGIPLRSLYSRNVNNLMMAGRPISCSYVAFASSRVLSTGSIVGEAVGVAAALCKQHQLSPRDVAAKHAGQCQQIILRQDGHIPGVTNTDPNDLARQARVSASSDSPLTFPEPNGEVPLVTPHALILPIAGDRIERIELPLRSVGDPVDVTLGLRSAAHVWDFRASEDLATATAKVPAKHDGWVAFDFNIDVKPHQLYYVHLPANPSLIWKTCKGGDGQPAVYPIGATGADKPGDKAWRPMLGGQVLCARVTPEQKPYGPANVNTGTHRADRWTNIWISEPTKPVKDQWLELKWDKPQTINTVQLTFDTDCNRRCILPLYKYADCVKRYALEAHTATGWTAVHEEDGNYFRRRVHQFEPVTTDRLRLRIMETNGAPTARVYEMRVYREDL